LRDTISGRVMYYPRLLGLSRPNAQYSPAWLRSRKLPQENRFKREFAPIAPSVVDLFEFADALGPAIVFIFSEVDRPP
jgi:hypothetical protein